MNSRLEKPVRRITNVLRSYSLSRKIANERARNIVQALLDSHTELEDVVLFLETKPGLLVGISDFDERVAAAKECFAIYVCCANSSHWSKLIALMECCGMTESEATEYLNRFITV